MKRVLRLTLTLLVLFGTAAPLLAQRGPAVARAASSCNQCHGELEFLRQNTKTLPEARAALVPDSVIAGSAHKQVACTECHERFGQFPHARGTTRTCASCHEKEAAAWQRGGHVQRADSEGASCAQCHGVHNAVSIDSVKGKPIIRRLNSACISCHQTERLHVNNPHADSTLCSSCHNAHDIQRKDVRTSSLWPVTQIETCGTCHDSIAAIWQQNDVHYRALTTNKQQLDGERASELTRKTRPPSCTDCHGAHGLNVTADSMTAAASVYRCGECHERAQASFADSYHGKATLLGSAASASCANCHGSHEILPESNPQSRVAQANLVQTCGECHEHARPAFVKYDSHPEPLNRDRNPWIFAAFWFMNSLLGFVIVVFGAHTFLWWLRLYLDKKQGKGHAHGQQGEHR